MEIAKENIARVLQRVGLVRRAALLLMAINNPESSFLVRKADRSDSAGGVLLRFGEKRLCIRQQDEKGQEDFQPVVRVAGVHQALNLHEHFLLERVQDLLDDDLIKLGFRNRVNGDGIAA